MKNKILHLITSLDIGGAEKALKTNLPHLSQFDNIICSLSTKGPIREQLESLGYQVYCLDGGKRMTWNSIKKFYQIIISEKPNLIITYLIHADIYGRIFGRLFGVKKIICYLRSELNNDKYKFFFQLEKITSILVTKYFAVSETVRITYIKKAGINPNKIVTVYNGADMKRFSTESRPETKKNLGLSDDDYPIITCVAKLRPEKNHEKLLSIFSELQKDYPKTKLLLAGDGPLKKELKELSRYLNVEGSVNFLGNVENVTEILKITDIFVLLSDYEGLANAIIEAMASGCCVVVSSIPSNRELIDDGINGFLVDKKNESGVLQTLRRVASDKELRLNLQAQAKTKANKFSIENTTEKFQAEITTVLS